MNRFHCETTTDFGIEGSVHAKDLDHLCWFVRRAIDVIGQRSGTITIEVLEAAETGTSGSDTAPEQTLREKREA